MSDKTTKITEVFDFKLSYLSEDDGRVTKDGVVLKTKAELNHITPDGINMRLQINGNADVMRARFGGWFSLDPATEITVSLKPVGIALAQSIMASKKPRLEDLTKTLDNDAEDDAEKILQALEDDSF